MRIEKELADEIIDLSPAIQYKFGIKIGYSHPMGAFLDDDDDFVIEEEGEYDPESRDFTFGGIFIVEANPYLKEENGIFVKTNYDLEQRSEKIDNFLIDFHKWIKNGDLIKEEYRQFKNYEWKPNGDGRFSIKEDCITSFSLYTRDLDELSQDLKDHIWEEMGDNYD